VATILLKVLLVPIVAVWVFHMSNRRHRDAGTRKRMATLGITGLLIAMWVAAYAFERYGVADAWLALPAAALAVIAVLGRRFLFPWRLRCTKCGKPLGFTRAFSLDANLCGDCAPGPGKGETTT
jgi:hypothetical protein